MGRGVNLLEGKAVVPVQQATASTPSNTPSSVEGSLKSATTSCQTPDNEPCAVGIMRDNAEAD